MLTGPSPRSPAPRHAGTVPVFTQMNRAEATVLTAVVALGIADAVLAQTNQPLVTDVLRKHRMLYLGFVGVLTLHVLDVLGPCDPFRAVIRLCTHEERNGAATHT